jgi:hypothetical protein
MNRKHCNLRLWIVALALLASESVVRADPPIVVEEARLEGDTPAAGGDFAWSGMAAWGDLLVVGARREDAVSIPAAGAAYVFVRDGLTWTQTARVTASTPQALAAFGSSVAIEGDRMVVGAHLENGPVAQDQGAAYVFVRSGSAWTEEARLTANDPQANAEFGISVAIQGDTIIVGTWGANGINASHEGAAYVFDRIGGVWTQTAKLVASDGAPDDEFGLKVAIDADTVACSARSKDSFVMPNIGATYVFVRSGGVWGEQATLMAPVPVGDGLFGQSVKIEGNTLVVGAAFEDGELGEDQGAAYVYVRSGTNWTLEAELVPSLPGDFDTYGISVDLEGDTIVVGARGHDGPILPGQGSAHVFNRSGGVWTEATVLTASDPGEDDYYGNTVALQGSRVFVGAPLWDAPALFNSGMAYVYRITSPVCCRGDLDADGQVTPSDAGPFVQVLLGGLTDADLLCAADVNEDGLVNSLDAQPFVNKMLSGGTCP